MLWSIFGSLEISVTFTILTYSGSVVSLFVLCATGRDTQCLVYEDDVGAINGFHSAQTCPRAI